MKLNTIVSAFSKSLRRNAGGSAVYSPYDEVIARTPELHCEALLLWLSRCGEAPAILKEWNPAWSPIYFMSDYSEVELGAVEEAFPQSESYLCDFHREQSWERWVHDRKHGLSTVDGEILLSLLRNCAWAPPARDEAKGLYNMEGKPSRASMAQH